jgi:2-polyprenyl-3-methyl-5-hydroxy-6-metoxy-1,4-benzoquinol methylase
MSDVGIPSAFVHCPVCGAENSAPERKVASFDLKKCLNCGMVYMNPQLSAEQIRLMYEDRDASALTDVYAKISASSAVRQSIDAKLRHLQSLRPEKGRLLDFACGSGTFLKSAQDAGWDAHGLELGKWAEHAARLGGIQNLHIGTLEEVGDSLGKFDVIHGAQVLEHLQTPRTELRTLKRMLRPNGMLYVDVPNYRTLPILTGRDDFMLNEPPQHVNYFTARTLSALLENSGYRVTSVGSGGGLKWENLIGRQIKSDIASAYGLVPEQSKVQTPRRPGISHALKSSLVQGIVRPLLYDRLRLGMVLFAVASPDGTEVTG